MVFVCVWLSEYHLTNRIQNPFHFIPLFIFSKSTLTLLVSQEDLPTFKFQLQQTVESKQKVYDWISASFQTVLVTKYMLTFIISHCCPLLTLCNGFSVSATAGCINRTKYFESHVGQSANVTEYRDYLEWCPHSSNFILRNKKKSQGTKSGEQGQERPHSCLEQPKITTASAQWWAPKAQTLWKYGACSSPPLESIGIFPRRCLTCQQSPKRYLHWQIC